jgi:hypothetical protein
MALQFRTKGSSDPMYNPARDFAYSHLTMVRCVIEAFNSDRWPEIFDTLCAAVPRNSLGSSTAHEDECWVKLLEAKDVYCSFINICCEDPEETYEDVIARSGWGDVGGPYKFAWLAMLGVVMTGQLFVGLRDTTAYDTPRSTDVEELLKNSHKSRVIHNFESAGDDLKQDLKAVIERLRDEGIDWEIIDRIVSREKGKE